MAHVMTKTKIPSKETQLLVLWGCIRTDSILKEFRQLLADEKLAKIDAYKHYRIALEKIEDRYSKKLPLQIRESIKETFNDEQQD